MDDIRSEIRAAFQKEQAVNPPTADLRPRIVRAVGAQPRRRSTNLQWVAAAAAIVLAALVVAGLMSTRLANRGSVPTHPKAVVTPSPVGDYGPPPAGVPLFYLQDPNHRGWYTGFDWNGVPRGTIKLATPLDASISLQQAPDGSAFQLSPYGKGGGNLFYNRLGLNQMAGTAGTWADDSQHTCSVVLDRQKYTWTLITGGPGQQPEGQTVTLLATDSGIGQTSINLAACSFKNDRAIAVRTSIAWPSEMWLVRLSDGKVLSHTPVDGNGKLVGVVASPDGSLIAENSMRSAAVGDQGASSTVIRRVADRTVRTSLDPTMGVLGFSADNSMVLVTTSPVLNGQPTHLAAVDLGTGNVIWRYDGTETFAGFQVAPVGSAFAVMLENAIRGGGHPVVTVVMVFGDGRTVDLPASYIRP